MAKHQFLSPGWIAAARAIRDQYVDEVEAPPSIRMNLTVSEVPFEPPLLVAHVNTSAGVIEFDEGHLENAEVSVTADYATVRTLFVGQDPQAVMAAFLAGKIRVQGDLAKLLALQAAIPPDTSAGERASEISNRIRDITAD